MKITIETNSATENESVTSQNPLPTGMMQTEPVSGGPAAPTATDPEPGVRVNGTQTAVTDTDGGMPPTQLVALLAQLAAATAPVGDSGMTDADDGGGAPSAD